ncbi:Hypothetical_protein [Hexamita inflata]|uniref:Hypothetical_protein n=1 Tax=Hexamita inflata TaxID=28002 RepID=A0AA86TVC0_9EUKA|nr:Hypothetical protein HINF_LOCUS17699 [Hexamita inflata]
MDFWAQVYDIPLHTKTYSFSGIQYIPVVRYNEKCMTLEDQDILSAKLIPRFIPSELLSSHPAPSPIKEFELFLKTKNLSYFTHGVNIKLAIQLSMNLFDEIHYGKIRVSYAMNRQPRVFTNDVFKAVSSIKFNNNQFDQILLFANQAVIQRKNRKSRLINELVFNYSVENGSVTKMNLEIDPNMDFAFIPETNLGQKLLELPQQLRFNVFFKFINKFNEIHAPRTNPLKQTNASSSVQLSHYQFAAQCEGLGFAIYNEDEEFIEFLSSFLLKSSAQNQYQLQNTNNEQPYVNFAKIQPNTQQIHKLPSDLTYSHLNLGFRQFKNPPQTEQSEQFIAQATPKRYPQQQIHGEIQLPPQPIIQNIPEEKIPTPEQALEYKEIFVYQEAKKVVPKVPEPEIVQEVVPVEVVKPRPPIFALDLAELEKAQQYQEDSDGVVDQVIHRNKKGKIQVKNKSERELLEKMINITHTKVRIENLTNEQADKVDTTLSDEMEQEITESVEEAHEDDYVNLFEIKLNISKRPKSPQKVSQIIENKIDPESLYNDVENNKNEEIEPETEENVEEELPELQPMQEANSIVHVEQKEDEEEKTEYKTEYITEVRNVSPKVRRAVSPKINKKRSALDELVNSNGGNIYGMVEDLLEM